jgi:hypothetical protein
MGIVQHMCGHHRHHHDTVERSTIPADDLRASDAERERVVDHLRAQAGEGRLTVEELDERLGTAYAVKTRSELAALTTDLPRPRRDARAAFNEHLRTYLMVMALLVAIWALTGMGYFWPIWPALGWGIAVVSDAPRRRRTPLNV